MSQSALSSAYGQRIALIRKHFPPGLPRYTPPAAGRGWRARMVDVAAGMVTSYAALSADAQQALLRAYDAHLPRSMA